MINLHRCCSPKNALPALLKQRSSSSPRPEGSPLLETTLSPVVSLKRSKEMNGNSPELGKRY